jgi:hypothetical protein
MSRKKLKKEKFKQDRSGQILYPIFYFFKLFDGNLFGGGGCA